MHRVKRDLKADYRHWHQVEISPDKNELWPPIVYVLGQERWTWLKQTPGGSYLIRWPSIEHPDRFLLAFEKHEDAVLWSLTWGGIARGD